MWKKCQERLKTFSKFEEKFSADCKQGKYRGCMFDCSSRHPILEVKCIKKSIRRCVNRISDNLKSVALLTGKLLRAIDYLKPLGKLPHKCAIYWAAFNIVENALEPKENKMGWDKHVPLAAMASIAVAYLGPPLQNAIRSKLMEKCVYVRLDLKSNPTTEELIDISTLEAHVLYHVDKSIQFFSCLLQAEMREEDRRLMYRPVPNTSPDEQLIRFFPTYDHFKPKALLGGMRRAWEWMAFVINQLGDDRPHMLSANLLAVFLKFTGWQMVLRYKKQMLKILRVVESRQISDVLNKMFLDANRTLGAGKQNEPEIVLNQIIFLRQIVEKLKNGRDLQWFKRFAIGRS